MSEVIAAGSWVEIGRIVLTPDERAAHLPAETRAVPLEMRVKGILVAATRLGEEAEVTTPAGRQLSGTLRELNPPYHHGFGAPIPALIPIGSELRALLRGEGE